MQQALEGSRRHCLRKMNLTYLNIMRGHFDNQRRVGVGIGIETKKTKQIKI